MFGRLHWGRPGLTRRRLVSTLKQSPESRRYGCDPKYRVWGPRRPAARPLPTDVLVKWSDGSDVLSSIQRGERRDQGQADLPAEQPAPSPRARLPSTDADPRWTFDRVESAPQGPPSVICLIATSGSLAVLPARNRMRRSAEFDATVKYGMRAAQPDIVVHVRRGSSREVTNGPRVGLIISKPVGSAVERHGVARRLRHVARIMLGDLHQSDQVVIRALPSSRHVSSAWLEQQLRNGLRRAFEMAGTDR
jgi:ribonuclease P protein component